MSKAPSALPLSFACLLACAVTAACGPAESTDPDGSACAADAASGLLIAPTDPLSDIPYTLGYPPYAVAGCALAYVAAPAPGESAGSLRLRDLRSGEESVLAPAAELPRRPSIAGDVVAWEATLDETSVIRVHDGDSTVTVSGPFDHAAEPRAAADGVVFTAFLAPGDDSDSDIALVLPGDSTATLLSAAPGQQRFPDISTTHIAFSDFAEDPDGRFDQDSSDLADVVLYERATGTATTRKLAGKQAFPLLGAAGKVAYLSWAPDHPEPKFSEYQLLVGDIAAAAGNDQLSANIRTAQPYIRPAAAGARLFWVQWPDTGSPALFVRPADLLSPAQRVDGVSGAALFGPAAAEHLTVIGARDDAGKVVLRAAEP